MAFCASCMKDSITIQGKQVSKQKKVCLICLAKEMAPPQSLPSPNKERHKMATVPGMVEKVRDGYNKDFIKKKKKDQLSADHVEVLNTSEFGGGGVFAAIVVSSMFIGKSLIDRHNIVSNALAEEFKTFNGFTQKCFMPEQWRVLGARILPVKPKHNSPNKL